MNSLTRYADGHVGPGAVVADRHLVRELHLVPVAALDGDVLSVQDQVRGGVDDLALGHPRQRTRPWRR